MRASRGFQTIMFLMPSGDTPFKIEASRELSFGRMKAQDGLNYDGVIYKTATEVKTLNFRDLVASKNLDLNALANGRKMHLVNTVNFGWVR